MGARWFLRIGPASSSGLWGPVECASGPREGEWQMFMERLQSAQSGVVADGAGSGDGDHR